MFFIEILSHFPFSSLSVLILTTMSNFYSETCFNKIAKIVMLIYVVLDRFKIINVAKWRTDAFKLALLVLCKFCKIWLHYVIIMSYFEFVLNFLFNGINIR